MSQPDPNTILSLDRAPTVSELIDCLQEMIEHRPDVADHSVFVEVETPLGDYAQRAMTFKLGRQYHGEDPEDMLVVRGEKEERTIG